MSATTYHLWLKPSGATYDGLAATIQELARELNAPVFEPHVTLLSLEGTEREHVRRTKELARQLKPFLVILTGLSHQDEYFQCFFIDVERSAQVLKANALAKQVFQQAERAYAPHLSLLYGLYPEMRKQSARGALTVQCSRFVRGECDPFDPRGQRRSERLARDLDCHHVRLNYLPRSPTGLPSRPQALSISTPRCVRAVTGASTI